MTGGWPGLCLDWEPVRKAAGQFVRELVKVLVPHSSLYAYDYWNEPHIEPASLGKGNYQVIIAPWHLIGKQRTCEGLRRLVEGGGTIILETSFGLFDERFYQNPLVPPCGLADAFGYREKESLMMNPDELPKPLPPSDRIYYEPEIEFTKPSRIGVKAKTYLTPITLTSALAIATCQGLTVAAMKKVGMGSVYYIGTNLGGSITTGNHGGVELLRGIITPAVRPDVTSDKLRPRLVPRSKRGLAVFNDSPEDQTDQIALPSHYHRTTNIHSRDEILPGDNSIRMTVPFEDVAVHLLEPSAGSVSAPPLPGDSARTENLIWSFRRLVKSRVLRTTDTFPAPRRIEESSEGRYICALSFTFC